MLRIKVGIFTLAALTVYAARSPAGEAVCGGKVEIASPGLPASWMEPDGRLVEDWGTVTVDVACEHAGPAPVVVRPILLDGCIPAAEAFSRRGPLQVRWTVYRAPVFPAGVDVLTVGLQSEKESPLEVWVRLGMPDEAEVGFATVRWQKRVVLSVLPQTLAATKSRDWGFITDTTAMVGWARPEGPADPAYANIRAGMGGCPIIYRFKVQPRSSALVVLGVCESHYDRAHIRPVLYEVEGARPEVVDPIGRWGRHKPGTLLFRARDVNGDGELEIAARPLPAAPDRNPILNVIWIFPPDKMPDLAKLAAGELSASAWRYVDVGGQRDQCYYEVRALRFPVVLAPQESKELTFLVACPGSSAPLPDTTAWTAETLRKAAREVFLAWQR